MRLSRYGLVLATVLISGMAPARQSARSGSDWPQFRGPSLTGMSPEKGIRKDWTAHRPALRWSLDLHDNGYAGPSVSKGIVYIVDHEGAEDVVRAIDLASGKERWRFAYAESNRNIYGFARATPTISQNRVFTLSREGRLLCLDAQTGKLLWQRHLVEDFAGKGPMWGYSAPPLVDQGKLIVLPGGSRAAVAALDPATGATIWSGGEGDTPGYGMPTPAVINGKRQYVTGVAKGFVGVDAANGTVLWRIPWETVDGTNVACPIISDNRVFICSSYQMGSALYEIGEDGPKELWRNQAIRAHMNTPILQDGHLYGIGDPGYLVCLRLKDGAVRWQEKGFEKGGVLGVDGTLIAVDGAGGDVVMARLTAERYEELGRFKPLGGQSWSPPIAANGALLIRNRQRLACLELR